VTLLHSVRPWMEGMDKLSLIRSAPMVKTGRSLLQALAVEPSLREGAWVRGEAVDQAQKLCMTATRTPNVLLELPSPAAWRGQPHTAVVLSPRPQRHQPLVLALVVLQDERQGQRPLALERQLGVALQQEVAFPLDPMTVATAGMVVQKNPCNFAGQAAHRVLHHRQRLLQHLRAAEMARGLYDGAVVTQAHLVRHHHLQEGTMGRMVSAVIEA